MNFAMRLWILAVAFLLVSTYGIGAQESSGLTIINTKVAAAIDGPEESLSISCGVSHPLGSASIMRVAATIFHGTKVTTLPRLYDDGTHGDATSDDGIFSLNVRSPAASGPCKLIVYAVDKDSNEIASEPVFFTIE